MVLLRRAEQPRRKKQSNQRGGKQPRYQGGTAEPNGGQAVVIWKHSSSRYQYENNWVTNGTATCEMNLQLFHVRSYSSVSKSALRFTRIRNWPRSEFQ